MLESCLFLESGKKDGPRDKLPSVRSPMEFLINVFPKTVSHVGFMKKAIKG